ncbi:DUF2637 domain-containing protein [Bifidobacterium callitrichidarum]|uniref:DUF2637 domain-containing protein n=1 Tax=Bifidobacterium callitrichidarum TaxID=2052941 RepID=A0A2U2N9K1_9BIFI|nr:DUF2637 domain-containing protein [Bifidobacterium callitrichidarum]PWG65649.1 hypothetical protein DF196_06870 [Bifidobacterium callitrichidarum]
MKDKTKIRLWPGFLAGTLIGLIAFLLSFDALQSLFVECGASPWLAWGGPICIDGTILLSTWAVWGFERNGIHYRWYPWAGFIVAGLLSILGNALHAWIQDGGLLPAWAGPMVMAIPPIALMYSTHLIVIVAGSQTAAEPTAEPALAAVEDKDSSVRFDEFQEWYLRLEAARRLMESVSDDEVVGMTQRKPTGKKSRKGTDTSWSQAPLFVAKDAVA